jgi:hypothetical protein
MQTHATYHNKVSMLGVLGEQKKQQTRPSHCCAHNPLAMPSAGTPPASRDNRMPASLLALFHARYPHSLSLCYTPMLPPRAQRYMPRSQPARSPLRPPPGAPRRSEHAWHYRGGLRRIRNWLGPQAKAGPAPARPSRAWRPGRDSEPRSPVPACYRPKLWRVLT